MLDKRASLYGFERELISSSPYQHLSYQRNSGAQTLHVYLEGDGRPWATRYTIAHDPTPTTSLVLELMSLDANDSLYLARPCYNDRAHSSPCNPSLWTSHRYANTVVNSMAVAIDHYATENQYQKIRLIGHSGGGSLAMLIADRLPKTEAVLTVAANLDTEAWTSLHGYSPLSGSLNPADLNPLPDHIWQLHLSGGLDQNVPQKINQKVFKQQTHAHIITFPNFTHNCCWNKVWPSILNALTTQDTRALARE